MTVDQALYKLEEVMHAQLYQPVKGDFMSLTRAWRGILEDLQEADREELNRLAAMIGRYQELTAQMGRVSA